MKTFIITGIQMRNKGSQAMFLSLSHALKEIYGDCEVIGFAFKTDAPEQYASKLLPYDDYTRLVFKYQLNRIPILANLSTRFAGLVRKTDKWDGKIEEMDRALRNADAIFDASGYTLGSGWSKKGGALLLDTIRMAKRYRKEIILMPQSFGPFDWGEDDDEEFRQEIRKELSYCTKIYAREKEGYDCLKALGLDNVELSADMVIREKPFPKATEIFASNDQEEIVWPADGSVGFIVNENLFRIGDTETVGTLYAQVLDDLVARGENVYFLNTSSADLGLTEKILSRSQNRDKVSVITGNYSSAQLIEMIARFKYVVASRYHSIVFAYRSGVPAIILGWAVKYSDLAEHFGQEEYVFDVRDQDLARITAKIDRMSERHALESQRIKDNLVELQSSSVVLDAVRSLRSSSDEGGEPISLAGN